jgi:predicted transcriptional regulator
MEGTISAIQRALHERRLSLDLTQDTVAKRAGMRQSYLSAIEKEKVDPRLSTLQDIARSLDLELVLVPKEALPTVRALIGQGPSLEDRPLFEVRPD